MIYTVTLNPTIDRTLHYAQLRLGELNRARLARMDLSGKGVNVSIALRCLGLESVMLGLSAGMTGKLLVDGLKAQDYACEFVTMANGETRSNITVIDEATGVTTKLNEPGPTATTADLAAFEALLRARLATGDVCVFSGSLPPGAPSDTYACLIGIAQGCGAVAVLDSSGEAFRGGAVAAPNWIKPNDVEASELLGCDVAELATPAGVAQALKAMLQKGPQRILLTLGARGAVLADALSGEMWWGQPPTIKEVNNVGAGDASLAGALYGWQQGLPAEEIVRWAVASGTATAQQEGTTFPTLARVQEVHELVSVIGL